KYLMMTHLTLDPLAGQTLLGWHVGTLSVPLSLVRFTFDMFTSKGKTKAAETNSKADGNLWRWQSPVEEKKTTSVIGIALDLGIQYSALLLSLMQTGAVIGNNFLVDAVGCSSDKCSVSQTGSFEDSQEQNLMAFRGGSLSVNRKPGPEKRMELAPPPNSTVIESDTQCIALPSAQKVASPRIQPVKQPCECTQGRCRPLSAGDTAGPVVQFSSARESSP
ncbi:hypothetical protein MJT46_006084, partial [Ovis ammon polii x Ovis aries]